jgi:D-erythronate 2-dehydrogenase
MRVVITGGAGYIGTLLIRALLKKGALSNRAGQTTAIDEIVLLDPSLATAEATSRKTGDPRIRTVCGSVVEPGAVESVVHGVDVSVFHLAAVLTGVTEHDLTTALQVNVDGTRNVLNALAACGAGSRMVMTSSVTVFTRDQTDSAVSDDTVVRPASVYGITKAVSEQLITAYRIAGKVDGRCGRLSTVVIRPKKIGVSAGASISDVLRDVALGRPCDILVEPQTRSALIDYDSCVNGLIRLHEVEPDVLDGNPVVNFPGISASIAEMEEAARAAAKRRGYEPGTTSRTPNAFAQKTIDAWPSVVDPTRAHALGITCKTSLAEVCDAFLDDYQSFWKSRLGGEGVA